MNTPIAELTRRLKSNPGDETALFALFKTLRSQGLVPEFVALLEVWSDAERGDNIPDRAMAELYFRIAGRSTEPRARELCRAALDACPAHLGALLLFDSLVDESWADELHARCQAFLEEAPFHAVSADARAFVIDKLAEAGHWGGPLQNPSSSPLGTADRPGRAGEEVTLLVRTGGADSKPAKATEG